MRHSERGRARRPTANSSGSRRSNWVRPATQSDRKCVKSPKKLQSFDDNPQKTRVGKQKHYSEGDQHYCLSERFSLCCESILMGLPRRRSPSVTKPHTWPWGGSPGSFDLVVLHEVGPYLQMCSEVQHQVLQRRVLQQFGFGEGWLAAGTVLAASESSVQVQHHVAEHVTEKQQPKEVVSEELKVRRIYKLHSLTSLYYSFYFWVHNINIIRIASNVIIVNREAVRTVKANGRGKRWQYQNQHTFVILTDSWSGKKSRRLRDEAIDKTLAALPMVDGNAGQVAAVAEGCQWRMQK